MITLFRWFSTYVRAAKHDFARFTYCSTLLSKMSNWESKLLSFFKLISFNFNESISFNSDVTSLEGEFYALVRREVYGRWYLSSLVMRRVFIGLFSTLILVVLTPAAVFNRVKFLPCCVMDPFAEVAPSDRMVLVRTVSPFTIDFFLCSSRSTSSFPIEITCLGGMSNTSRGLILAVYAFTSEPCL